MAPASSHPRRAAPPAPFPREEGTTRQHTAALVLLGALSGAPALAQSQPLYAYVSLPAFDRDGNPVMKEGNQERLEDGFCLFWKPGWLTRYEHLPVTSNRVWWSALSYTVNPRTRQVTIYRLWGPNAVAAPKGGWEPTGPGEVGYQSRGFTVPMYDTPQEGWPCTKETWAAAAEERTYASPSAPSRPIGPSSGPMFPQRSILNPCMYTNGHRVPGCH